MIIQASVEVEVGGRGLEVSVLSWYGSAGQGKIRMMALSSSARTA